MLNEVVELVGRDKEIANMIACLQVGRNVLLEGFVGVGKTSLTIEVAKSLGSQVFRVDGDGRYTEQKLTGWFDPPSVIQKGYVTEAFVPGPLTEAMMTGGVLLVNELNRLPEGSQNVLLPAIDEGVLQIPRYGVICAKKSFRVIATQNPRDFVGTSHLSEAILDRFELIVLDYQSEIDEIRIVRSHLACSLLKKEKSENIDIDQLASTVVKITRATRSDPKIRRGASIRAAIAIAEIAVSLMGDGKDQVTALFDASSMALPNRIEMERELVEFDKSPQEAIDNWVNELIQSATGKDVDFKKKTTGQMSS